MKIGKMKPNQIDWVLLFYFVSNIAQCIINFFKIRCGFIGQLFKHFVQIYDMTHDKIVENEKAVQDKKVNSRTASFITENYVISHTT